MLALLTAILAWDAVTPDVPFGSNETGWVFNLDMGYNAWLAGPTPRFPKNRNETGIIVDMLTLVQKHGPVRMVSFTVARLTYPQIRHYLELLLRNGLVTEVKDSSGALYDLSDQGEEFLKITKNLSLNGGGVSHLRVSEIKPFKSIPGKDKHCETCGSPARKEVRYEGADAVVVKRFCEECILSKKHLQY